LHPSFIDTLEFFFVNNFNAQLHWLLILYRLKLDSNKFLLSKLGISVYALMYIVLAASQGDHIL